jgi:hypothetical protein
MKKIFLAGILFCLLSIIFIPVFANAAIVNCGNAADGSDACTICNFFETLVNIYNFLVTDIATPLAVIAIIIGAIFMMASAGNPNLMSKGKTILYSAIIGLVLVFGSYLIINFVLTTIGYAQSWGTINCS